MCAGDAIRERVVSPARTGMARLIGDRWPGGLDFIGGGINRGLPPAATIVRPPAADSCDDSVGCIAGSGVDVVQVWPGD